MPGSPGPPSGILSSPLPMFTLPQENESFGGLYLFLPFVASPC